MITFCRRSCLGLIALLLWATPPAWAESSAGNSPQYELTVRLDPAARTIAVTGTLTVPVDPATPALDLRLDPALTITAFTINGQTQAPDRTGPHWRIPLAGMDNDTRQITFSYHGPLSGRQVAHLDDHDDWYPRKPGQPARFTTHIITPAPFRAVTTGRPFNEQATPTERQASFDTMAPAPGLSLFVGEWRLANQTVATPTGDVLVRTWLPERLAGLAPTYLDAAARHLAGYTKTIGAYPYGAFHIVAAPVPVGLGYPGLTYIGEQVLPLPFVPETSLRHEVLHTWWGNAVEVDYPAGNWAEGLTTYMADYARARERDAAAARDMRLGWLRDYAALPPEDDRPPVAFLAKTHDASQIVGYNKVAFFFHMLEEKIGSPAFLRGVQTFWRDHAFGTAGWDDLRHAFEAASKQDLAPFFDQWLKQAGAPTLHLGEARVQATATGFETMFTLEQKRPAYELDVPVRLETGDDPIDHVVALTGPRATFTIASSIRPKSLAIDPGFDLFRRLLPNETPPIFRDVTLAVETRVALFTPDREAALNLAQALLRRPVTPLAANTPLPSTGPLLIIGEDRAPTPVPRPESLPPSQTTRADAWIGRTQTGQAVMTVIVKTPAAFAETARRLPHYGRKSHVRLAEDGRVTSGTAPVMAGPLHRTLSK